MPKGRYVLAVSGGVDSMALLNMLSNSPGLELVAAHFNHGIRDDSDEDETLVEEAAIRYGLPFESASGKLGRHASEAAARAARYEFLEGIRCKYEAAAIITAHHQDDLIETAIINLLRGTGRRGLVALAANPSVARPLLGYSKREIIKYAHACQLVWREDKSNLDDSYLRNYVRLHLMPGLTAGQRQKIIANIDKIAKIEEDISPQIAELSRKVLDDRSIDRQSFTALPTEVGSELVLYWLRQQRTRQPDKKTVKRLNVALRASKEGTICQISDGLDLLIGKKSARFSHSL